MKYFSLFAVLGLLSCLDANAMQKHNISKEDEKKPKREAYYYSAQDGRKLEEFYAYILQAEWSVYSIALNRRQLLEGKVAPDALLYSDMIIQSMNKNLEKLAQQHLRHFMISGQITSITPNTQFHFIQHAQHPPFIPPLVSKPSDKPVVNKQTQEAKDTQKINITIKPQGPISIPPNTLTGQIPPIPLPGIEQRQAQLNSLAQRSSQAAQGTSKADQTSKEQDSEKK